MKLLVMIEDVEIPNMPRFKKSQEVRVSDPIAEILLERGHAKENKGKSRAKVKQDKKSTKSKGGTPDVTVTRK